MSNSDNHFYIASPKYTFISKPEDYANLDPAFQCHPDNTREERIQRMLEKTPLEQLPKDLIPKYRLGVQPPKFHFGIPVIVKYLLDLAVANKFAVFLPDAKKQCVGNLTIQETMRRLRKNIYLELKFDCSPRLCSVRTSEKSVVFLSFLTSIDGTTGFRCGPKELGKTVKEYLKLDRPLMWYLDKTMSDWHAGELYREARIPIDESW